MTCSKGGTLMKIRFCENNEGAGAVFKRLRAEYPELNLKRKKCLKKCGTCSSSLFALVDGQPLRGANSDDLYRQIAALLAAA